MGKEGQSGPPQMSRGRQEEALSGGFVTCGTSCSARWLGQQVNISGKDPVEMAGTQVAGAG